MNAVERILVALLVLGLVACGGDDDESTPADAGSVADTAPDSAGDPVADPDDTTNGTADTNGFEFPIGESGPITHLRITGLESPVEIKLTEDGIPSIRCQSDEDCAAALGYLHARDRFVQMDIRRRVVRGRLSEIVTGGDELLEIDAAARALFSTPDGRHLEEVALAHASEKTLGLLEAYANGVNSWLDDLRNGENGASLSVEYAYALVALGDEMARWTPEDSLATVVALVDTLTNEGGGDLANGEVFASIQADTEYDESVFDDYFRPRPFLDSPVMHDYTYPAPNEKSAARPVRRDLHLADHARVLREARAALDQIHRILGRGDGGGSNTWVVGPSLTAEGDPLLSNDPHLPLANPATWYIAHLDATTDGDGELHVAGLTFPGLPWVLMGQNEHIAWGGTAGALDMADVYVEQLTEDGSGVVFEGSGVPFVEVDNSFPQVDGSVATRTALFVPHHGPVLAIDREAGTAVSLRWTGNSMTTDVNAQTELARAADVMEARAALKSYTATGQSSVVIDTHGDLAWFTFNRVPIRPWASPSEPAYLPLDGTGANEWDGFVDYDDLPQAINPEEGYVATANNDMTGANYDGDPTNDGHPLLQSYVASGFRRARIVHRIEASDQHSPETMRDIVGDTYSLVGQHLTPAFLAVDRADLSPNAQALYDAVEAWTFECPTGLATADPEGDPSSDPDERAEALGCAAFHRLLSEAWGRWIWDEWTDREWVRGPGLDAFFRALVRPEELTHPDIFWDDIETDAQTETQQQILTAAFERAANRLQAQVGDDPSGWLWGRLHTLTFRADLFSSFGVSRYDEGPFSKDGGLYTVNVASPTVGAPTLNTTFGATARLLCEAPSSGVTCSIQLAGGQPHLRDADAYFSLFQRWLANEPVDLPFDHATLDAPTIVGTPAEE